MAVQTVVNFLKSTPYAKLSGDGKEISCRCWICNDSTTRLDATHMNVKVEVAVGEPMIYHCFKGTCGASGILKPEDLQLMGCTDMQTLLDLATHNSKISKKFDFKFNAKQNRALEMVNLHTKTNFEKLKYINRRLGTNFVPGDLRDLKIQLSLYEFLRVNEIKKLAFPERVCDLLEDYTIGFVSMYGDYIIFRDITKENITKRRYTMYRATGVAQEGDTKLYCVPCELDLLDPDPANINIAEGTFSILGAYLHTDIGRNHRNNLFLANCGTGYARTIDHITRQFGLIKVHIHIWSDSEIPIKFYEKIYKTLKNRLLVVGFEVHYNKLAEDFGYPQSKIGINTVTLK